MANVGGPTSSPGHLSANYDDDDVVLTGSFSFNNEHLAVDEDDYETYLDDKKEIVDADV